jgi:single-strand DNA-binding protein
MVRSYSRQRERHREGDRGVPEMLKAQILGNLGNDPEMRYSAVGAAFLRFNVASSYRTRTPAGEWEEKTEWVRVTVFGARAETLGQYLKKGSRVFVDGRLEARPWTDREGHVRAGLEIVASDVEFMSQRGPDVDMDELPVRASVTDERRMPLDTAVHGSPARRGGTAVADHGNDADLEDLPF